VIWNGRSYSISNGLPRVGVVRHWREDVEYDSRHVLEYEDGRMEVAHIDRYNPDRGHLLEHLLFDTPLVAASVALWVWFK
jgi:hypothetical protein